MKTIKFNEDEIKTIKILLSMEALNLQRKKRQIFASMELERLPAIVNELNQLETLSLKFSTCVDA